MEKWSYIFALGSNLCFASSTLVFTAFAKKTSVYWMNFFKAAVAAVLCAICLFVLQKWDSTPAAGYFFASGIIGLMIGDIFLLKAFNEMGPGRSLLLYGFQPLFLAIASFYFFGEIFPLTKVLAILFLIACLVIFSFESKKKHGHWGTKGLLFALTGILLDAVGIIFTKYGYKSFPTMDPLQAHFLRSSGATLGFLVLTFFRPIYLVPLFRKFSKREKAIVLAGAFTGTFFSLFLYMTAIKFGPIASLSAIAVTAPFFASIIECFWHKTWPSRYLLAAFAFFIVGFSILFY